MEFFAPKVDYAQNERSPAVGDGSRRLYPLSRGISAGRCCFQALAGTHWLASDELIRRPGPPVRSEWGEEARPEDYLHLRRGARERPDPWDRPAPGQDRRRMDHPAPAPGRRKTNCHTPDRWSGEEEPAPGRWAKGSVRERPELPEAGQSTPDHRRSDRLIPNHPSLDRWCHCHSPAGPHHRGWTTRILNSPAIRRGIGR